MTFILLELWVCSSLWPAALKMFTPMDLQVISDWIFSIKHHWLYLISEDRAVDVFYLSSQQAGGTGQHDSNTAIPFPFWASSSSTTSSSYLSSVLLSSHPSQYSHPPALLFISIDSSSFISPLLHRLSPSVWDTWHWGHREVWQDQYVLTKVLDS